MKVLRFFRAAAVRVARRPYLPGVVFLAPLVLTLLAVLLLLANVCDSPFRFLPDFPDRLILFLGDLAAFLAYFTAPKIALAMFVLPVAMLFVARYRPAGLKMLAASLCSLFVGLLLCAAIFIVSLLALSTDQLEIAGENLAREAEAARTGETAYVRKPIPRLRQGWWTFANGRYSLQRKEKDKDLYWLVDEWWRYRAGEGRFDSRLLLADVARWEERRDGLFVETQGGKCYELDFETGRLTGCPQKERGRRER